MSSKRNSASKQQVRSHGLAVVTLVLVGLFASALVYIKTNREVPAENTQIAARADDAGQPTENRPKYEFYNELPRRELKVEPPQAPRQAEPPPRQQQAEQQRPSQEQETANREPERREPPRSEPPRRESPPPQQQAAAAGSRYVVQAGAYTLYSQADRARARLAMLGVDARIEEGTSNGLPIYRIRVGPMSNTDADALRQRLRSNNIESIALKVN